MLSRKPTRPTTFGVAMAAAVMLTACYEPREDDTFEPNDTFDQARPLTLGDTVAASAVEGNPDVFKVTADAGTVLRFDAVHIAYDPCPVFNVHDPARQELLGQDLTNDCGFPLEQTRLIDGAAIEVHAVEKELVYIITVPVSSDGDHYLTITEDNAGDNIAPFSWDYKLTASIGP